MSAAAKQFTTFFLSGRLYGIDVMRVQEVTKVLPATQIRLAPDYVMGLINLRGQIATAIGLRELFGVEATEQSEGMAVVCKTDGHLLSFQVDKIGDVIEVSEDSFEPTPDIVDPTIKKFMKGVYKTEGSILSVIELESITTELNKRTEQEKRGEES